jgi:hypothetical protein
MVWLLRTCASACESVATQARGASIHTRLGFGCAKQEEIEKRDAERKIEKRIYLLLQALRNHHSVDTCGAKMPVFEENPINVNQKFRCEYQLLYYITV